MSDKTHRVVVYQDCPIYGERTMIGKGYPMTEEQANKLADANAETEENPNKLFIVEPVE